MSEQGKTDVGGEDEEREGDEGPDRGEESVLGSPKKSQTPRPVTKRSPVAPSSPTPTPVLSSQTSP